MKKGFTLIELLVVIAILAVLATATVLVLNPAELLKQGRDSTRISDLAALNSAIALWTADVLPGTGWAVATKCTFNAQAPGEVAASCTADTDTTVDNTGWVPLNFGLIAAGSPLSRLPMDPNNGGTCKAAVTVSTTICQYAIRMTATVGVYELDTQMESVKFYLGGSSDVTSNTKDGGNDNGVYEIGSSLTLW
jgi:prepilin-type N-terminal cleavage/methylation domain-containing protein